MKIPRSLSQKIVAISPFSSVKNAGHPIVDDQFYFSYLLSRKFDFEFYTGEQSAVLLRNIFPEEVHKIRVLNPYVMRGLGHYKLSRQIKVHSRSRVIFFGYSEYLVFIWYLLNFFKLFSLYLVSSNNISSRRIRLYPWRFKLFFILIWPRLKMLILDTQYQLGLVRKIFSTLDLRCFVRKHHLMAPIHELPEATVGDRIVISYFGPEKPEKPLAALANLCQSLAPEKYIIRIYNVDKDKIQEMFGTFDVPRHVQVCEGRIHYQEYINAYISTDLVLLTHTRDFEGKLSGNLCDCVSCGIPFISQSMSPALDMLNQYGDIGFICDYETPGWADVLDAKLNQEAVLAMKLNMRKIAQSFSLEKVRMSLDQALN